MLGTSPFIGAGQFGLKALEYYKTFCLKPSNIAKIYREAYQLGIKALQLGVNRCPGIGVERIDLNHRGSSNRLEDISIYHFSFPSFFTMRSKYNHYEGLVQ